MINKMKHPLYYVWQSMLNRCRNSKSPSFHRYGGRGIAVCDRWKGSFDAFVADMGERPAGYTIERKNNDGNYEPSNCKWATRKEQQMNRGNAVFVEIQGSKFRAVELSEFTGMKPDTIIERAKQGLTFAEVIAPGRRVFVDGLKLGGLANGERNKAKTHCKHGHEYTPENTAPNGKNGRACRRCHADRQLRRTRGIQQSAHL